MITHKFTVRKERNNAVMLRLTANRKSSELALGVSLTPEILEEILNGETPRGFKEQAMVVRHYQNVLADKLNELTNEETKALSASDFQKRIREEIFGRRNPGAKKKGNLLPFFNEKIKSIQKVNTRLNYTHTLAQIEGFCKDKNTAFHKDLECLEFAELNLKWMSAFESWMAAKGLAVNTRWTYLTYLRSIINKALDDEVITQDPCRRFKVKREETRKRSLSVEDLRKLFNCEATPQQQYHIDMFKLTFMLCGINAADLYGLKTITRSGRIEYRRAKTGRLYSIKAEPEAMEIIKKYKGKQNLLNIADKCKSVHNYNILANEMLKRIGKRIDNADDGFGKVESDLSRISLYWARHSWATIARKIGISIDDIALALGHSNGHAVTSIYIDENLEAIDIANRRVLNYVLYNQK